MTRRGLSPVSKSPKRRVVTILVAVVGVLFLLWLAAPCTVVSNTREARRSEGEQLLGSARDYCRVEWSRTGDIEKVREMLTTEVRAGTFSGKYFSVAPELKQTPQGGVLHTAPGVESVHDDGIGYVEFAWETAEWTLKWEP